MTTRISLNGNDWLFKDFIGEDWRWRDAHKPVTRDRRRWLIGSVPGSIYHDLLQLGEIPSPYFERNSRLVEWVPQRTWVYKKTFLVSEDLRGRRIQLHFKGVDYEAQFFLNGELLGSHSGMYNPAVFEVSDKLLYGTENLLAVVLEAAPQEQPQVGRTSRVHTHKARMNYGWDFCPRLVHQGVWDDVYLEITGPVRIENLFVRPQLTANFHQADVSVSIELDSTIHTPAVVQISLKYAGVIVANRQVEHTLAPGRIVLHADLEVDHPRLWWPNGYGEQPLYEAEVSVMLPEFPFPSDSSTGEGLEAKAERVVPFGIRRIELVPNKAADPTALPYTFVVNERKLYAKGWNWVPMDAMYGVPRPEKLERLLQLAQRAHVNLLRVWGGGLIEKDAFYDLCDRLGLMVWQEFILSSSGIDNVPSSSPEYIAMLAGEAEQIVPRRRDHPSLALWCGGNELQSGPELPLDDTHPSLAALKGVVRHLDPDRSWLPTSPSGRVFGNTLENIVRDPSALHDVHGPWEYQGVSEQYELYNQGTSLFHSEFGVEGITNLKTLNATIAPDHQWPISLFDNPHWFHLGAWWVRRRVWDQVFGELPDVVSYVRATQFIQYDGLRYALEADRRRKYHNSGTLPWQFNEPFPMAACTSAVDYYARPKPVYYAVAHAYELVHVSARFPTLAWMGREQFEAEVWVCNSHIRPLTDVVLRWRLIGVSGQVVAERTSRSNVEQNCAASLAAIRHPLAELEDVFFLDLQLRDSGNSLLSTNRYLFTRAANLAPLLLQPHTTLSVQHESAGDEWTLAVTNTGEHTAMFVWLEDARPLTATGYVYFDRNYFCLFPGESQSVIVTWQNVRLDERQIEVKGWNT